MELDTLIAEWETCNVDFKRELVLRSGDQKAEFIKDVLGLATTQSSGRRWMVIGFDDKTRQQYVPSDPSERQTYQSQLTSIKVEHLEQILSSYTDPPVPIRLRHLRYRKGPAVAIEIRRDARHVPYRVSKELRGEKRHLRPGEIFVRHGSITQPPTAQELKALEFEAERARQKVSEVDVDDELLSDDYAAQSEAA